MLDYITNFKRESDQCVDYTECEECCSNCEVSDTCDCSCFTVNKDANCVTCWFR